MTAYNEAPPAEPEDDRIGGGAGAPLPQGRDQRRARRVWWPAVLGCLLALGLAVAALVVTTTGGPARGPRIAAPTDGSADAGFARDMAVHHQQAVAMAFLVRDRTSDEEVRLLAYDVATTQSNQRGMLLGWLDLWGLSATFGRPPMAWMHMGHTYHAHDGSLMPGMATDTELDQLRAARGRAAEVLYLKLMIAHHRGGVEMAQGAIDTAENASVRRLAKSMVTAQNSEIAAMTQMLGERGARP